MTTLPDADGTLRQRMRDGRLQQITEHVDRIERELAEVQELVTRLREDDGEHVGVRDMQLSGQRQVTSACWSPGGPVAVQEDSASL